MKPAEKSAVTKRSVVIGGHKTSVSLETPFWNEVRVIAGTLGMNVSSLLRKIDRERQSANLSSAIRVFVLEHVRDAARAASREQHDQPAAPTLWPADLRPL